MNRLLLILTAACASAPKAPPSATISSYSGTGCVELAVIRPMPLDAARALVPARYKLAPGPDGLAQMSFALYRCDSFALDGAPARGGIVGEHSPHRGSRRQPRKARLAAAPRYDGEAA